MDNSDLDRLEELERKATPGPWKWEACAGEVQLEGNVQYPEMSPVLVTRGCGNRRETSKGVKGCNGADATDPLQGCPLHPDMYDRTLIADLRNHAPELIRLARVGLAVETLAGEATLQLDCWAGEKPPAILTTFRTGQPETFKGNNLVDVLKQATTGGSGG